MTRRPCSAGLAILATLAAALPQAGAWAAPLSEPAGPHREMVDADRYPWSSVAKLFNSVGGSCTGAVIARDKVLTAAHCLYAFRTRRFLPPDAIHVLLGYDRGDYRVHARVLRYRLGPGYDPLSERSTATADWAVLDLSAPLPEGVEPLRLAEGMPADQTGIMVGGFARDRAYKMTADRACAITGRPEGGRLIAHDCVIAPGDSGAPLLGRAGPGTWSVLGVAVGIMHQDGRTIGIAAPIPPRLLAKDADGH